VWSDPEVLCEVGVNGQNDKTGKSGKNEQNDRTTNEKTTNEKRQKWVKRTIFA